MNPTLSLNPIADLNALLTFPFMVNALEAGTIVAVLAAVVGWYMVLRRQTFAGHTLSVMAFPGAAGAALAGLPTALGYYLACGAAALLMRGARGSSGLGSPGRGYGTETATIATLISNGRPFITRPARWRNTNRLAIAQSAGKSRNDNSEMPRNLVIESSVQRKRVGATC